MKNLILFLAVIAFSTAGIAQNGKVSSASSLMISQKYEKAWENIQIASDVDNPKAKKSLVNYKTYIVKAQIIISMVENKKTDLLAKIDDPIQAAFDCCKKAQELDNDKAMKYFITDLPRLSGAAYNAAATAYEKDDMIEAARMFELSAEIVAFDAKSTGFEKADSVSIFNSALCYARAEEYDRAIASYKKSIAIGYNLDIVFKEMIVIYNQQGKKDEAVSMMKELVDNAEDKDLRMFALTSLIDFYNESEQTDLALKYLAEAIVDDPTNPILYLSQGSSYSVSEMPLKAIESFTKCVELDPKNLNAHFNIGVAYYNLGLKEELKAQDLPMSATDADFKKIKDDANALFSKAIEPMKSVYDIDSTQKVAVETLKNIYYRLQDDANYKVYDDILKSM